MIRTVTPDDANAIADIYNHYIKNTIITFEGTPVSGVEMRKRIKNITQEYPWLVCDINGVIVGYAYANAWKFRCAYEFSVETTVYLDVPKVGKGYGQQLYAELISRLKMSNAHVIIGTITLPNKASVALHEKMGFIKVAHFKEIGYKFNQWIDVGCWQLTIESSDNIQSKCS